jgi:iron complex outermembrane receptor protein
MRVTVAVVIACYSLFGLCVAAEADASIKSPVNIPSQPLGSALQALAKDRGFQVVYESDEVNSRTTHGASGNLTTDEALKRILDGTGLTYRRAGEGGVSIVPVSAAGVRSQETQSEGSAGEVPAKDEKGGKSLWDRFRLAQVAKGQGAAIAGAVGSGPSSANESEQSTVEEVVVTALHRSAGVQSVPISIEAISGDTLSKTGASQLNDYFRAVPSLNVTAGQGGANQISIRGVNAAGEATVGVYYDETPVTGPSATTQNSGANAPDLNLFDVQRVEVLRGPQGTLYGASSMAGTIRIIFNKPNYNQYEFATEDQVASTTGGSIGYFTKGMANVPLLSDKLAVRVVGYYEQRPGWIDNVHFGTTNVNDSNNRGVRTLIGFKPDDVTTLTATLLYQKSSADDLQGWFPSVGTYKSNSPVQLPFDQQTQLYNLTGERKLGLGTLTTTASWYRYDYVRAADFTPTANMYAHTASACAAYFAQKSACTASQMSAWTAHGLSLLPIIAYQPAFVRSQDYEVRLASEEHAPAWLQWTIGGFYEKRFDHIVSENVSVVPATGALTDPLQLDGSRFVQTNERQAAGFGELSVEPLADLTLTAGARYYSYEKSTAGQLTLGNPIFATVANSLSSVGTTASGWLEKLNISYRLNSRDIVYAAASKGFRPGGANNIPALRANLIAYRPDSLWNYELGFKSSWFDNRLVFNTAVYDVEWSNMQTTARTADGLFSFITNAGKARSRGTEVDLTVLPMRGLSVHAGVGYSDAKLTQDQSSSAVLVTASTGRAGDLIPNVPDWTASLGAAYTWALNGNFNYLLSGDYAYTGRLQSTFRTTDPYYAAYGNFGTLSLRAGVENENMGVYLFGQNIGNTVGNTAVLSTFGLTRLSYGIAPSTYGVNVRYRW